MWNTLVLGQDTGLAVVYYVRYVLRPLDATMLMSISSLALWRARSLSAVAVAVLESFHNALLCIINTFYYTVLYDEENGGY